MERINTFAPDRRAQIGDGTPYAGRANLKADCPIHTSALQLPLNFPYTHRVTRRPSDTFISVSFASSRPRIRAPFERRSPHLLRLAGSRVHPPAIANNYR